MKRCRHTRKALGLLILFGASQRIPAGTYAGTTQCEPQTGCQAGHTVSGSPPFTVTPFGVVHPLGFNEAGGSVQIRVCVDALPETGLAAVTEWAVAMLNGLQARTENCYGCRTIEEGWPPGGGEFALSSVVLHELGHCGLALDHGNRLWDTIPGGNHELTSYTLSWGDAAGGISPGPDFIRGSFDDTHVAQGGQLAESVFWFRKADNNPVIVDTAVIDSLTFSRSIVTGLPLGHSWSANANRRVAETLGHATTQSVMIAGQPPAQFFMGLAGDDVNTARMARTGVDRLAGTADDYVVDLQVVSCQDLHELRITFSPIDPSGEVAGRCPVAVDLAYAQNPALARDYELVLVSPQTELLLEINSDIPWDTGVPILGDGFETGNFIGWSSVSP